MKIKKFIAPSMREALLLIKQDLGEEAIILKTRKIPRKLLSLGGHDEIEVTAAVDESIVTAQPPPLRYRAGEGERQRASAGPLPPEKPVFAAQRPLSGNQSLRSQPPFAGRGGGANPLRFRIVTIWRSKTTSGNCAK